MMQKFKLLNHTADIKLEIYGTDVNDLFNSAYLAWFNIVGEIIEIKNKYEEVEISIIENNLEYLLVEYLRELNYYLTVKKIFLINPKISINKNEDFYTINCKLKGLSMKDCNIIIKEEIKAITLHNLSIKSINNKQVATIVLDV